MWRSCLYPVQTQLLLTLFVTYSEILSQRYQSAGCSTKSRDHTMSTGAKSYRLCVTQKCTEIGGRASVTYSRCWPRRSLPRCFEALGIPIPLCPSGSSLELCSTLENCVSFQKGLLVTVILIGYLSNNLSATWTMWIDVLKCHGAVQQKELQHGLLE